MFNIQTLKISYFCDSDLLLPQYRPGGIDSKNYLEHFGTAKNESNILFRTYD